MIAQNGKEDNNVDSLSMVSKGPQVAQPSSTVGGFKWYVIHTHSGAEKSVKDDIIDRATKANMSDHIKDMMVPVMEVAEVKNGKKVISEKKLMPGYVLMNVHMTDNLWHLIKSTRKVSKFLDSGKIPAIVSDSEVENILKQIKIKEKEVEQSARYSVGDSVKVNEDPFGSFVGIIEEVDQEKSKLKVGVTIFGRVTSLSLNFNQVEKVGK